MSDRPTSVIKPPAEANPRTDPALDFPDKPFGEMRRGDYEAIGFLAGLEVHQQLDTNRKLFCRCPSRRYVDDWDAEVLRHMRPTLSELGEYDGTALMEYKTRKEIVYQLERGSVCTYEIDDTPPFPIDPEAVRIAIELCEMLELQLVSELHVMRKQYLDGSIPTGFQRTAMVGLAGAIPFVDPELGVGRELRIRQLSLEEDACREISDVGHRITFRTDRLGMPLTETVTEPELVTPQEVAAAGRILADAARATRRVLRGPGAGRQDVNVSVAGGRRVEIKGVDTHRGIPRLVHVEAFRQLNLLRIRAELRDRGVTPEMLAVPEGGLPWEVSDLVEDVGSLLAGRGVRRAVADRSMRYVAVRLRGFARVLGHPTQPGRRFEHEIRERVRVIACPVDNRFMVDSETDEGTLDGREWQAVRDAVGATNDDAVVVVWMPEEDAATAAREVLIRGADALHGVPAETRQAHRDGTTGFERILPGPDRMYPDTDTPPIPIADSTIDAIRVELSERPWVRERRYVEKGLSLEVARRLVRSPWAELFDELDPPAGPVAKRIAWVFLHRLTHFARRGLLGSHVTAARFRALVNHLSAGSIRLEATTRAVNRLVLELGVPTRAVLKSFMIREDDAARLSTALSRVLGECSALHTADDAARRRWAIGQLMRDFIGRVDPKAVAAELEGSALPTSSEASP